MSLLATFASPATKFIDRTRGLNCPLYALAVLPLAIRLERAEVVEAHMEDDEFSSGLIATYSDTTGHELVRLESTVSFVWDSYSLAYRGICDRVGVRIRE